MKARWVALSKTIKWNGEDGIPTISVREDLDAEDECPPTAKEMFRRFAIANDESYRKGKAFVAFIKEDSKELGSIIGDLPRQVRWAVSSALSEGRLVELLCYQLDVDCNGQ